MKLKHHLLLMLLSLCSITSYAYDFEVDGLYYDLVSASERTCKLIGCSSSTTKLNIPNKVSTRGVELKVVDYEPQTFKGNTSLNSINIEAEFKIIYAETFYNCRNVESIILPKTLESIEDYAFYNCHAENEIIISMNVKKLGKECLNYAKNIRIEDSDTDIRIEKEALAHVETIYLGRNISHGEYNVEHNDGNYSYFESFVKGDIFGINLKNVSFGNKINRISHSLFYNSSSLVSVFIPKNITSIEDNAFYGCRSLSEITFEDSDVSISIGNIYKEEKKYGYEYDASNRTTTLYSSREDYGPFAHCQLKKVYIGRSVEYIPCIEDQSSFGYISPSVYGSNFDRYYSIVVSHKRVNGMPSLALFPDMGQNDISWGNVSRKIPSFCFTGNKKITTLEIQGIDEIGQYAFAYCGNLNRVDLSNKISVKDFAFANCSCLKVSNIGQEVLEIGASAFSDCSSLRKVSYLSSAPVSANCFKNCSNLQWIQLGDKVTDIKSNAFAYCNAISNIGVLAQIPPVFENKNEFSAINKFDATIYIPNGSTSAYEQADVWKDFLFKEEKPMPEYVYNHTISESTSKNMVVKGDLTGALINQINASKLIETLDLQSSSIVLDNENAYYETGKRIEDPYLHGDDVDVYRNAPYYSYKYYTAPTTVSGSEKEYSSSGKLINVITNCFSSELTNANLNGNLKIIKLPSSLSKLGENAIVGTSLTELYATSTTPPTATTASFGKTNKSTCVLYVPEGGKSAYSTATGWKDFKNIVEAVSDNYISVQPTNENRKVQLARQDAGAKYQWYKYIDKTDKVIDITNLLSASSGCWENTGNGWLSNMHAAKSSAILSYEHDFYAGDVLSFDWSVSSEEMFDQLQCYLGDELLLVASGEKNGSFNKTIESAVSGKLSFVYIKDNIIDKGNDNASISNVKISSSLERTVQVPEAIDGETGNVLQAGAVSVGDKVFCIVTLFDGKQLKSNEFVIEKLPIPSDKYCLVLEKKDGSLEKYVLSDRPEISISNNTVTVTSEKVQTDCPIVDFVRFYFEENKADEISVNTASSFAFKYNDNMVRISGAEKAEVYSADGMKLMDQHTTNGEIRMNICNLTPGLYVIKTDKKTIKIRK